MEKKSNNTVLFVVIGVGKKVERALNCVQQEFGVYKVVCYNQSEISQYCVCMLTI